MKLSDMKIEKITNYDPYNNRSKADGTVTEWIARNEYGNAVAFGYTKAECIEDAKRYIKYET